MSCADNGITRSAALCNKTWAGLTHDPAIVRTGTGRPRPLRGVRNDATVVIFLRCTRRDE
jgi:hypothetical protein